MLKKKGNSKKLLYLMIVLFIAGFLFSFLSEHGDDGRKTDKEVFDIVSNFFEKISDNYTMDINLYKGEENYKLNYMSDGQVEMYSSSTFPKTGYLVYKGNYYYLDNNELKKTSSIDINSVFNDKLYNINLLKKVMNSCEYNVTSSIRANCDFDLKIFFDIYNELYETNIEVSETSSFKIEILYEGNNIDNIKIPYNSILKVLNGDEEDIEYNIRLSDVNTNDFAEYIPFIEKIN